MRANNSLVEDVRVGRQNVAREQLSVLLDRTIGEIEEPRELLLELAHRLVSYEELLKAVVPKEAVPLRDVAAELVPHQQILRVHLLARDLKSRPEVRLVRI